MKNILGKIMSKLNSNKLKLKISELLKSKITPDEFSHYPEEEFENVCKTFFNGLLWKRVEKRSLKEDYEMYFSSENFEFNNFGYEGYDKLLYSKYKNDPKKGKKCIYRRFAAPGDLSDNYEMFIITDPDDSEIIAWSVSSD